MELISKEELINKINAYMVTTPDVTMVRKLINEMPIVESRPKGKWVQSDQDKLLLQIKCSVCNRAIYLSEYYNYCPNCGADMRGEE